MCACLFASNLSNCGSKEDNATVLEEEHRKLDIQRVSVFSLQTAYGRKASFTYCTYVEGNGSSILIAMPLSYRYSAFILIQKFARKFDSKKFCKPSSADSSNNLIDSKNMLNSLQSSDVLKSECGRSIKLLTFLLVTGRSRYSQARGVDTAQHTKRMIISQRTLRYLVETVHKKYEITFLVT